jgi:hypothetical protein
VIDALQGADRGWSQLDLIAHYQPRSAFT